MEKEEVRDKCLFTQQYDLAVKPKSDRLSREQFSIPRDSFLFTIVGMRLTVEVDAELLAMFEKIASNSAAHFMFVGYFEDYESKLAPYEKLRARTSYIGFQEDIMAVYNITDILINPTRSGGGTGLVYALQAELPILSLSFGDGGLVTKNFPKIIDYEHMAAIALDMINNSELTEEYKKISLAEAPRFTGQLIPRIIEEFERFAVRKLGANSAASG
jgi:glycosyltransferase involved in cell wall biosynthesis